MAIANCQMCHRKPLRLSGGNACKTCGMSMKDSGKEFCSRICRIMYKN